MLAASLDRLEALHWPQNSFMVSIFTIEFRGVAAKKFWERRNRFGGGGGRNPPKSQFSGKS